MNDNTLKVSETILAYIDILGYKEILSKKNQDDLNKTLNSISKILNLVNESKCYQLMKYEFTDKITSLFYSDCFVISVSIKDLKKKDPILVLFIILSEVIIDFINEGFFVRGGISKELNYIDDKFVFGKAIIKAVELESIKAVNPRVIIDNNLLNMINNITENNKRINFEKDHFANFVLKDSDGLLFINYLYLPYMNLYNENEKLKEQIIKFLELHKCKILENISANSERERVLSKYIWVAKYHNFFCSYYLKESPTLLIKEYVDDFSFIKHSN